MVGVVVAPRPEPRPYAPPSDVGSDAWFTHAAVTLRRALVARNGLLDGGDAAAAALAWAWEHRERLPAMGNPLGYLYRVGQSSLRPARRFAKRRAELVPDDLVAALPDADVDVFRALDRLTPEQRVSVVLVHMYRFRYREVAELLEISEAAVTNHVHRGLARLRRLLGAGQTTNDRRTTDTADTGRTSTGTTRRQR